MKTPRFNLITGLLATAVALLLGIFIPYCYDGLGEGPALIKHKVRSSEIVHQICGDASIKFYVIPWRLSISDSEEEGELTMSYWIHCAGRTATVDAELNHLGAGWEFRSLVLHHDGASFQLTTSPSK